ncbi:amidohydrolase [Microaerobacter geothermalis]|uniref:amidohydrolase n=1 Tax=Microaerobacter geothermalis TaxID=674972 RepID=UPI001F1FF2A8|nr:amidohydrolase [Microaerobacter geothermalis]MCF6093341.1 amidohydrolase [Microaerobacter geothermalis]
MRLLIKGVTIVTMNHQNEIIKNGAMLVEDGIITYVGSESGLTVDQLNEANIIKNESSKVMLPGLINTHGHAAMSLLRGYADDLPLQEWLQEKMWPMEGQFTSDHVKWGAQLAMVEMLKSGTTCFVDMYDHMDQVAEGVELSGMRAVLTRGVIGLCSEEERQRKLQEAFDFARNWHGQAGGRITAMMSPHSSYTCSPEYILQIMNKAADLHLPVHIHMSETMREVEQNVKEYGKRPVQHLLDLGVFSHPVLVAHAVHINEEEMTIMAENNVHVSHNPGSNLKLGSGIAPVPRMLEKGISVSLGTDSAASNNNLDLFEEIRLAALIHKGVSHDPTVIPASVALKMGTIYGAESIFIQDIGSLEVGKKADFILLDTKQAHFHPEHDIISQLVYSASGQDVTDVYVEGKQVVNHGQCLYLDEERIIYEVNRLVSKMN